MRRGVAVLLAAAALLGGCGRGEDPYRIDTVVRIPADAGETEDQAWETLPASTLYPLWAPTEPDPGFEFTVPSDIEEETKQENKKQSGTAKTETKETRPRATEATSPRTDSSDVPEAVYTPGVLERELLDAVNELRASENLSALTLDGLLSDMACARSRELAVLWSHTRPDGRDYATLAEDFGWDGVLTAELLAYISGGENGAAAAAKWAEVQPHRGYLLDSDVTCAGIGTYRENGVTYICLLISQ